MKGTFFKVCLSANTTFKTLHSDSNLIIAELMEHIHNQALKDTESI